METFYQFVFRWLIWNRTSVLVKITQELNMAILRRYMPRLLKRLEPLLFIRRKLGIRTKCMAWWTVLMVTIEFLFWSMSLTFTASILVNLEYIRVMYTNNVCSTVHRSRNFICIKWVNCSPKTTIVSLDRVKVNTFVVQSYTTVILSWPEAKLLRHFHICFAFDILLIVLVYKTHITCKHKLFVILMATFINQFPLVLFWISINS